MAEDEVPRNEKAKPMNRRLSAVLSSLIAIAAVSVGASIVGGEARSGASDVYVAPASLDCSDPIVVASTGPTDAESFAPMRFGQAPDMMLSHSLSVDLPAGTYSVQASTHDSYSYRAEVNAQANEQVRLVITAGGEAVSATAYTSDLADGAHTAWAVSELGSFTLDAPADGVTIEHFGANNAVAGPNSLKVIALCIAGEAAEEEPADDVDDAVCDDASDDGAVEPADESAADDVADEDVVADESIECDEAPCATDASAEGAADGADADAAADDGATSDGATNDEAAECGDEPAIDPCADDAVDGAVDGVLEGDDSDVTADDGAASDEAAECGEAPCAADDGDVEADAVDGEAADAAGAECGEAPVAHPCEATDDDLTEGDAAEGDVSEGDAADCGEAPVVDPCDAADGDTNDGLADDAVADECNEVPVVDDPCNQASDDADIPIECIDGEAADEVDPCTLENGDERVADGEELPAECEKDEPVTEEPIDLVIEEDVTEEPPAELPQSDVPVSEPPATDPPATDPPVTQAPVADPPAEADPTPSPTAPPTSPPVDTAPAGPSIEPAVESGSPVSSVEIPFVEQSNEPIPGAVNQQTPGQGALPVTGSTSGLLVMIGLSLAIAGLSLLSLVGRRYVAAD